MSNQQKDPLDWYKQLLELVHSTSLAPDFGGALGTLVEASSRLVPCTGVAVMWLENDRLEVVSSSGATSPPQGLVLPVGQMGAARAVLDNLRPVIVPNTIDDPRWTPVPGEEHVNAWMGVPLLFENRALGLIEWTEQRPAAFQNGDVEAAQELAYLAVPVLYKARLLHDTRQRLRELVEPTPIEFSARLDLATALQPVVQEALDLTGAGSSFLFLPTEERDRLRCITALGEKAEYLQKMALRGDGTLGTWRIPVLHLPDRLVGGPSDRERLAALGIDPSLILPLRVAGAHEGILGIALPSSRQTLDHNEIRLMTHLASQCSVIVERSHGRKPERPKYDYELVLQASPLGVGVLTVTGDIRVCNPALAGLLSCSDETPIGRNLADFLAHNDGRSLQHALEEVAITGQRRQVDARIELNPGEYRHTRMSLAYAPLSEDVGGNVVAMVEDVSPLKILEEERVEHLSELREKAAQLQELDRLRSRFVSNVSHELRTPLAVIKLYATLARKGRPEKQSYYLQTIGQETHRLETIVENILDLTRLDRDILTISPEWVVPEEIIAQVLEVYEESARKYGIHLMNRVEGTLPTLWADKNHLIQMVTNLLDNALKYTPRGREVWVAARQIGSDDRPLLEIAVGDTGSGIPEEEQGKVFERFYRGSNNSSSSTGTGLGLAIVRELILQHGGRVTLTSAVGEGSVFALQFPLGPSPSRNLAARAGD